MLVPASNSQWFAQKPQKTILILHVACFGCTWDVSLCCMLHASVALAGYCLCCMLHASVAFAASPSVLQASVAAAVLHASVAAAVLHASVALVRLHVACFCCTDLLHCCVAQPMLMYRPQKFSGIQPHEKRLVFFLTFGCRKILG
jgi:hypothetical protein